MKICKLMQIWGWKHEKYICCGIRSKITKIKAKVQAPKI